MLKNIPAWKEIVKHFAPGWYAAVMGTAVLVVDFFVFRSVIPFAEALQFFFLVLALVMFVLISIPWTIRFFTDFDQVRQSIQHPVSAAFFPTMPISLLVLGIALEKAGHYLLPEYMLLPILQGLWLAGALGIGFFALLILVIFFRKHDLKWESANFGWLIPPVSALIVPVLGNNLTVMTAGTPWSAFHAIVSLVYLGIGGMLFLFVMGAVFTRHLFLAPLPPQLTPTIWVGIAPTAILTIVTLRMVDPVKILFNLAPDTVNVLAALSKIVAVSFWGFAFFWLLMAISMTLVQAVKTGLPFAMSWWAFTFPFGAFVVATGVLFEAFQAQLFLFVGLVSLVVFLLVWALVFIQTIRHILNGKIFIPAH